jgi:hypothetical protein
MSRLLQSAHFQLDVGQTICGELFFILSRSQQLNFRNLNTDKALLMIVAAGLWINIAIPLFHPTGANAQNDQELNKIVLHVSSIANGTCTNRRICWPRAFLPSCSE